MSRIASVPLLIWIPFASFSVIRAWAAWVARGEAGDYRFAGVYRGEHYGWLDGYLARKRGQITTMGMLLDPLAGQLMVSAAYILLVALYPGWFRVDRGAGDWAGVPGVSCGRLRRARGFTIEASEIGKLKTVIQIGVWCGDLRTAGIIGTGVGLLLLSTLLRSRRFTG